MENRVFVKVAGSRVVVEVRQKGDCCAPFCYHNPMTRTFDLRENGSVWNTNTLYEANRYAATVAGLIGCDAETLTAARYGALCGDVYVNPFEK